MSDIFSKYFKSTFTLKSLLLQLSLKLKSKEENEQFDIILNKLSTIIITFDFELKGSIRSYIDTRHTFEQLLYLIFCKINETKSDVYMYHMFKSKNLFKYDEECIKWDRDKLRNKLLATENPSICYFLSDNPNDGYYWHKLHEMIGAAIMKYILLYGYLFRRLKNTETMYVQISGLQFNRIYPPLVDQLLQNENQKRYEVNRHNNNNNNNLAGIEENKENSNNNNNTASYKTLKDAFEKEFSKILSEKYENKEADVKTQLQKLGNKKLLRGKMMYDRNFGIKIPHVYVYSSTSHQLDFITTKLINERILSKVNLSGYEDQDHLKQMNAVLMILFKKFIISFRSCPVRVFLDCYCKHVKKKEVKKQQQQPTRKRKRDDSVLEIPDPTISFNDFVDTKNVYCFVRRCLMHVLEYSDKDDNLCAPLVGGQDNFKIICKFIKTLLNSLRFDTFTLNNLLNGIKTTKISYLLTLKCDRYKRLVLMAVLLWLLEDYVFVLLRSCFYVTETCATNAKIFFYLKDNWKKLVEQNFNKHQYKQNYNLEKMPTSNVLDLCSKRETSGVHMGRLLPKNVDPANTDFRIISGSKALNPCTKRIFSINYQFISLYQCLKYLVQKEPTLTGFACPSHVDIQRRYSNFINSTTYNRPANIHDPIKKWNFIKIDIEKCFDNVDVEKILFYLKEKFTQHLNNEQKLFTIFKYSIISFDLDKKHLKRNFNFLTQLHRIEEKGFFNGIQDFITNLEEDIQHYHHLQNSIFVPMGIHERNIVLTKLEKSLTLCFSNVLIKIHDQLYTRLTGIMHGSICSRIICDLYLGKLEMDLFFTNKLQSATNNESFVDELGEKRVRMKLNSLNELVLRVVDDYLIICDSAERLRAIKNLLDTKLKLNNAKTVEIIWSKPENTGMNIITSTMMIKNESTMIISDSEESDSDIEILSENLEHNINFLANNSKRYVLWNGFNIDVHTLDIYLNYDKYFNTDLSNRISRNMIKKNSFYEFNLKYLRLFNNLFNMNLLINLRINRIQAIVRNLVDIFALSAIRFQLLHEMKVIPDEIVNNISLQIKLIINLCYLGNHKIKSNLRDLLYDCFTTSFLLLKFICLNVFIKIFKFKNNNNDDDESECKKEKRRNLTKLCNVLEKLLNKLNFIKCIRLYDASFILCQLNALIDEQLQKFKQCRL